MKKINLNGGFFPVPKKAFKLLFELDHLNSSDRVLYICLLKLENDYCHDDNTWFYRSVEDLMINTGLSNKTIIGSIQNLRETGMIEVMRKPIKKNDKTNSRETINHFSIIKMK